MLLGDSAVAHGGGDATASCRGNKKPLQGLTDRTPGARNECEGSSWDGGGSAWNGSVAHEDGGIVEQGPAKKRRKCGEASDEDVAGRAAEEGRGGTEARVHALRGEARGSQGRAAGHLLHSALGDDVGESHRRECHGGLRRDELDFRCDVQGVGGRQRGVSREGPVEGQHHVGLLGSGLPSVSSSGSSSKGVISESAVGPPAHLNAPRREAHGQRGRGLEEAGDADAADPRRDARRHRLDVRGDHGADGHGERATAKRSRRDQAAGCQIPIWMEPPTWLYLPASGIVGGRHLRDEEDSYGPRVHGGSGVGNQTAAAAQIRGRGSSPGGAGGATDGGGEHVGDGRIGKGRDKGRRLLGDHASISISLSDHAERVRVKAQRIQEGTWPIGNTTEATAKERLAAIRERIRARASGAAEAEEARRLCGESALPDLAGGGGLPTLAHSAIGGGADQHRGEREQLDHELPLELRSIQAIEASKMHLAFRIDARAGDAGDDALGGAAGSVQAAEVAQRAEGWGELSRSAGGAVRTGGTTSTAAAAAANFAAWHSNAAEETP